MDKHEILKRYYGYDSFREGQEEIIESLISGRDAFAIMPTGAGKSICYQVPALMSGGITLVISPLISLMSDQVKALNSMGVHAAYLNSSLTQGQYMKALSNAAKGQYKIIYVAPERLETAEFVNFARSADISLVAVDEAHCVSQWGQDFRPSYLNISKFIGALPDRPVVGAFTATATKDVQDDVLCILDLHNPRVIVTGFDRENLYFAVRHPKDKYAELSRFVTENRYSSGIIYCATRNNVEEVCRKLCMEGFLATRYHAGLSDEERARNQDDFIYDRKPVMVATNAFGMGIDKSNVRYVVHYNMPKNLESYYQEAGRAGRDGQDARCILLYSGQDVAINKFLIEKSAQRDDIDLETRLIIASREQERLKKMTIYCSTSDCLRDYMLRYFGEYKSPYCGNCSNCQTQFEEIDVSCAARNFIGCAKESGQRFGMNVLIDAIHGATSAKVKKFDLLKNSYYASESSVNIVRLRQIVNYLSANDYIFITEGQYPIIKLTEKGEAFLNDASQKVTMKLPKSQLTASATTSKSSRRKEKFPDTATKDYDLALFEKLRKLRLELARKDNMPPYIVFSDKTLVSMCRQLPKDKAEMLNVSGVGEAKFSKYGEAFLEAING